MFSDDRAHDGKTTGTINTLKNKFINRTNKDEFVSQSRPGARLGSGWVGDGFNRLEMTQIWENAPKEMRQKIIRYIIKIGEAILAEN